MSVDIKYLATLLANGVSQTQSAAAVGCTPSYVSQLVAEDETLQSHLQIEDAKLAVISLNRTASLSKIEKQLLTKVEELVPFSESLGEATTALQKVAELKEKRELTRTSGRGAGNVIELNLGKIANSKLEVAMGDNRVIMHIGGMDMTRAPSKKVKEMLDARKVADANTDETSEEGDIDVWEIPESNAGGM